MEEEVRAAPPPVDRVPRRCLDVGLLVLDYDVVVRPSETRRASPSRRRRRLPRR